MTNENKCDTKFFVLLAFVMGCSVLLVVVVAFWLPGTLLNPNTGTTLLGNATAIPVASPVYVGSGTFNMNGGF
jgi:hypothetical protein